MKRLFSIAILALMTISLGAADNLKLRTVVIDAGHGGKDPGCVSKDKKTYEKTITLDIANSLASRIKDAYPDVNVVLTRSTDKFVSLDDRASIANKADAQLFISIHINAAASASPNGFSVHVLGQSSNKNRDLFAYNMDVCRRENSVVQLEDDYSTRYSGFDPSDPESYIFMLLMQNSHLEQSLKFAQTVQKNLKGGPIKADRGLWQDPFLVLWQTAMPSVLVELGFISNQNDLAALRQKSNRDLLVARLYRAFSEYKSAYDSSTSIGEQPEETPAQAVESEESAAPASADRSAVLYGIQVLASKKKVDVKDATCIETGGYFKYYVAVSESKETTLSKMSETRKKYPDCFLVKIEGETVSRIL